MATPEATAQPDELLGSPGGEVGEAPDLEPAPKSPPLPMLPVELAALVREVFSLFELKDRKGEVEEKDVPTIIRGLGLNPTEAQAEELLAEMRNDLADAPKVKGPPAVTFEKLELAVRRAVLQRPTEFQRTPKEVMLKALRTLDLDRKGCFETDELKKLVMTSAAHPFTEAEAAALVEAATDPKTGRVYIDDLVELLGRDRTIGLSKLVEPAAS